MSRLRIALFARPSNFAARALDELAASHEVVAVARPADARLGAALRRLARPGVPGRFEARARKLRATLLDTSAFDAPFVERLAALRPDLICIALFPRIVPTAVTAIAPLGAINAHPSLLPRHRGPLPLFWTYHADDRETGATIHHASEAFDAGDVILQERFALPRAYPVERLDRDMAERAARMLRQAADELARGTASRSVQDESMSTRAPLIQRGVATVPFDRWNVERTWHFLAGLSGQYQEPLADARGRPVAYSRVVGFRRAAPSFTPGQVERVGERLELHCIDGIVELA